MGKVGNVQPSNPLLPVQQREERRQRGDNAPKQEREPTPAKVGVDDDNRQDRRHIDEYI